jgi:hypothetical protein
MMEENVQCLLIDIQRLLEVNESVLKAAARLVDDKVLVEMIENVIKFDEEKIYQIDRILP